MKCGLLFMIWTITNALIIQHDPPQSSGWTNYETKLLTHGVTPVTSCTPSVLGNVLPLSSSNLLQQAILNSFAIQDVSQATPGFDLSNVKFEKDEVVRVMDANTVKLKRTGLVSFAAVQTPSGYKDDFRFPDCMAKSPVSKAKQFLPAGTKVKIKLTEDPASASRPRALIVLIDGGKLVNAELVREGFAKPVNRGRDAVEKLLPGFTDYLNSLQREAEGKNLGMYKKCDLVETAADDQFEPLDVTVEIQYGDDGGKQILRQKEEVGAPPRNPGDVRKCADFETFEDALRYYEKYFPYYGDVAKLDRDGDGVPCSGLPHTKVSEKYRMKKPNVKINEH